MSYCKDRENSEKWEFWQKLHNVMVDSNMFVAVPMFLTEKEKPNFENKTVNTSLWFGEKYFFEAVFETQNLAWIDTIVHTNAELISVAYRGENERNIVHYAAMYENKQFLEWAAPAFKVNI